MKSAYGISRIDQPEKKNHGFYVRIKHDGKANLRFFADKACGGKAGALAAAEKYRDAIVARFPKTKREAIARRRTRIKQCEVVGVTHIVSRASSNGKVYEYWQAAWDEAGARKTRKFSISRYGEKGALEMAKKVMALRGGRRKKR